MRGFNYAKDSHYHQFFSLYAIFRTNVSYYFYIYIIDIDMFNYSTQATVYLILVIITSIINLICYYMLLGMWGFVGYLLYVIIVIPIIILWMYNIDCLTTGDCQVWSWVITALTLISVISSTVILVAVAVNPSLSNDLLFNPFVVKYDLQQLPPPKVVITTTPAAAAAAAATTTPATATAVAPALTQSQLYQQQGEINKEFLRKDLKPEERQKLWLQQLELDYQQLVLHQKIMQQQLLNKDLKPEEKIGYQNRIIIAQRLIEQRDKMTKPVLAPTQDPQVENSKILQQLLLQQQQFIEQEQKKQGITKEQKDALSQQALIIYNDLQYLLPPPATTVK